DAAGVPTFAVDLVGGSLGSVTIPFGEFATATVGAVTLDPNPSPGQPLITVGGSLTQADTGATLTFGEGAGPLAEWGGRVGGFTIDADGTLRLGDGFFADLTIPAGERFGLPDFLPLEFEQIGIGLPAGVGPGDALDQ